MSIIYEVKYHPNIQKDRFLTINMTLDIDNNKSIFRENSEREADSIKMNNGNPMHSLGFENQFYIKKDLLHNKISKILTNGEFNFLLPIEENLKWNISSEKKKIGIYKTQKATVTYGNREWTAWFTNEIPISEGPYIFNGLPGLIISIVDNSGDYQFDLIQTKKLKNLFDVRLKTLDIDWSKYDQLAKSYYQNPHPELEQRGDKKMIFIGKDGKVADLDDTRKRMNKEQQEYILENNNPIELNHKINYN
jgi:GLPGLI family protein